MLELVKVAVTGGLSCGKSTVCQLFQQCGAFVVSADAIVHSLLTLNTEAGKKIADWMGPEVVVDNTLDRKLIAKRVFSDPQELKKLEALLHPLVKKEIAKAYDSVKNTHAYTLFVAEIPLLFEALSEAEWPKDFDYIVTVSAPDELAKKRFKQGPEEWELRGRLLRPLSEKEKRSDFVIYNQGSYEELKSQVQNLTNHIKNHESRRHTFRNS